MRGDAWVVVGESVGSPVFLSLCHSTAPSVLPHLLSTHSPHALARSLAFRPGQPSPAPQEAEQTPDVVVDPSAPAALKLAAARLSGLDLGLEQEQYCYEALTDLRDVPTPTHAPRYVCESVLSVGASRKCNQALLAHG